jgi:hypothetical protein
MRRSTRHPRRPSGQVLVIFASGLVLLLAIGALVVDLGFVFMIRRQEQNAADPGAIAAARYIRSAGGTNADMVNAACFYAHQNGFFGGPSSTAACVPANDSNGAVLTVNHPPSAAAGNLQGRTDMVEVILRRPHQSFLGGVVGITRVDVATSAVAAFSSGDSNSNSLIALDNTSNCATANVSGGAQVTITPTIDPSTGLPFDGGYVHVNSSCGNPVNLNNACGNGEGTAALKIDGANSSLTAPHVFTHGTCTRANNNTFNAPLTEDAVVIGDPLANIPEPQIADYPAGSCLGVTTTPTGVNSRGICVFNAAGTYDLSPGVFYGGWDIRNNVTLHLNPGVYIIAGGGIKLNAGGTITSVSSVSGAIAPILIFNTDNPSYSCPSGPQYACQQNVDFTASSTLAVRGIDSGPFRGILIWQDGTASGSDQPVTLGGQTNLTIAGTVYAPKALVTLTGGSSGTGVASVQIIAWQFNITGGATLAMPYDPRELYRLDQKGLVR